MSERREEKALENFGLEKEERIEDTQSRDILSFLRGKLPEQKSKVHRDRIKQRTAKGFYIEPNVCQRCGRRECNCRPREEGLNLGW